MRDILTLTFVTIALTACNNGFDMNNGNSSQAVVHYAVTMNAQGGMTLSNNADSVVSGEQVVTTVVPDAGFANSVLVGGTCPVGSWSGDTYTSGTIDKPCSLIFSEVQVNSLSFVSGSASELDFSQIFNVGAIVPDASMFPQYNTDGSGGGGFDGNGLAYSDSCLNDPITVSSVAVKIGASNQNSSFNSQSGAMLNVPQGNYQTLQILGAAVNGNQANQVFIVNYTTGPAQIIKQSFSDWSWSSANSNEMIAKDCQYADAFNGGQQGGDHYLYAYQFTLDSSRVVASIQTPANVNVQIAAMNLGAPF